MGNDVLVAHPYKHHAFELGAAIAEAGRNVQFVTPFYSKGLTALLSRLPMNAGRRASGYAHPGLPASNVRCPLAATLLRAALGTTRPIAFRDAFDRMTARYVLESAGRFEWLVTLQDYMPRTVDAAVQVGVRIWSDQILNQTDGAMARIAAHHRVLGLPIPDHDESKNDAILQKAQVITVPSTYYERSLLSGGIPPGDIYKIPYGAFFEPQHAVPHTAARERQEFRVVARANTIRKGGHLLLSAIESWGERWVAALGGGTMLVSVLGELAPSLVGKLSALAIPRNVRITHGTIPHNLVGELYGNADLFVMPSLSESLSLACLEALSFGLPLVVTPYTGIEDVAGVCGFVVEDSMDSLGEGILEAIASRQQFPGMSIRGRALVRDVYNWQRYRRLMKDMIEARM
ncbi:glycosyltransferase family 4 protein [Burkholderia sp. Bp9099]|uniref:glycosyltransferase family 4 protein n=1 Tax=Burkholderia sp. Bp9099 TaxID=2184568 RepID=UPI000F601A91|nr:glycosyltransferase family 4 protein [Burkholderia sp. Bp9099]RQZ41926.1 glycosyltransferase [Burkholderia sp. Bp9099]